MLQVLVLFFFCVYSSAIYCGQRGPLKKFLDFPEETKAGVSVVCTMKIKRGGSFKAKDVTFRCEDDLRTGAKPGDTVLGIEWSTSGVFGGAKKSRAVLLAAVPVQDDGEGDILLSYQGEVLESKGASVADLLDMAKPSAEEQTRKTFSIGPTGGLAADLISYINDVSRACLPKKSHKRGRK
jgi:hypothetical protein